MTLVTLWIFQETKKGNDWRRDMDIVTRGHLNRETESVLMAVENKCGKFRNSKTDMTG